MKMIDFTNIDYLKKGTEKQKRVYEVLVQHKIFEKLQSFDPILVGTVPIGIDTEDSDLDIICFYDDQKNFESALTKNLSEFDDFNIRSKRYQWKDSIIGSFSINEFTIELFGQNTPVKKQLSYQHMIKEYEILTAMGEGFRRKVIKLKKQGYKTEPAFAKLLGIDGDPYLELLKFKLTNSS